MADAELKVGDVAHDLVEKGKVQVVAKAADTIAQHREQPDVDYDLASYKAHPLLDVEDDDTVWTCVYLPDSPTTNFSGTYDFPESRLARVPVEEANEDVQRVQRSQLVTTLTALLENAHASDEADDLPVSNTQAIVECWPNALMEYLREAEELTEAAQLTADQGGEE